MSHSVVKDFPTQTDNTLVIVVNKNGDVSVDQETLENMMKLGNSEVSILRVDGEDGSTVDLTLDTFHRTETIMEDLTISVEDEVTRNYNNFLMDHCYTPLTSPSQQKPLIAPDQIENELELDDLAQTLSILEGSDKPSAPVTPVKSVASVKASQKSQKDQKDLVNSDKNVSMLNKVNKMGVNSVYKGVKTVLKGSKVFKKTEHPLIESDPDDDDLNDSDFELNESPAKIKQSKRTYNRRRSKFEQTEINHEMRNKTVKVRKGMKHIVYKPHSPQKPQELPKVEPPPPPPAPEPVKSPDAKKLPKKDKKAPKPIVDDGIALFSTPDIIRRVGSGKSGDKTPEKLSDSPESPKVAKPARIEDRSKSDSRLSTESKVRTPHRHSLDSKSPEKIRERTSSESKHSDRRLSSASDKATDSLDTSLDQSLTQNAPLPNSVPIHEGGVTNETFESISEAVGNLENDMGPTPSAEMIRSIIHTEDTKTYSTPLETQNVDSAVINPVATPVDQPQLNLEGTGLDIDQGILDNINADELIPEDILYQVAKLVENPDVQNVIDRTLVDANLSLEPAISAPIADPQTALSVQPQTQISATLNQPSSTAAQSQQIPTKNTTQRPIQIVRSDGRVVILPPIEKPATRSSKKKQEPEPQQKQPPPPPPQQQQHHAPQPQHPHPQQQTIIPSPSQPKLQSIRHPGQKLPEEADDPAASDIDSDSDESWNSEDDPDRLWCICKQPHNNRFMICCDTCEDWFHGKCVNVTKAMGQQMEEQGKEWMCPNCIKKANMPAQSVQPVANNAPAKPAKVTNEMSKRKSTDGPPCIVCSSPSRANSVYCSDACILKHAQGVEKDTSKAQKSSAQRIIVFERSTGKCLSGPNAPTAANLKQWLREHPGFEVVRPVNKQNLVQSKLQLVKNPQGKEGVGLAVNRKGIQVGVLPHSSKQQNTIKLIPAGKLNMPGMKTAGAKQTIQTPPTKKQIQTTLKSPTQTTPTPLKSKPTTPTSAKSEKAVARERKQKLQPMQQAPDTPKQNAQENIRDTVKKTLNEQLLTRIKEVEDIKLTDEEVDKMATEIEVQLYKLFGDSGPKYRTKYRSLIFNIKDTKNQTLWRRICEKTIAPAQLVRLSPEEMASQELARWRERENKHQLDMIKKSELEMLSINRTYVLKTHKGEQVMEDRPSVKVDSTDIMPGLGADSTSEQDASTLTDKSDATDHSERRSTKHSRRDREREKRSSRDRTSESRSSSKDRRGSKDHGKRSKRSRSRDRDRDRSSHRNERKRSRSRDRHHRSSHKSSRHKRDKHSTEHLDKKSREILDNLDKIGLPPENRLWKHVPHQDVQIATPDSDSDHEPSSTVTIPTPPRSTEQEELQNQPVKQPEPVVSVEAPAPKTEPKPEAPPKLTRAVDPRLNRSTSVETPKSESPQPPAPPSASNSPVPPVVQSKFTSESKEAIIWEGNINMVDVAKFIINLHEVSGDCSGLGTELPSTLEIVGRISHDTVWDYIGKMRRSNSKLISVLRLTADDAEEQFQYLALYTYLSSRDRLGVIKSSNSAVKDFYILPLASHTPVPQALLPLNGPGFEESRPNLLLGIIVRAKRKRSNPLDIISGSSSAKRSRVENSPNISQSSTSSATGRSYTPPPTRPDPRIRLPTVPAAAISNDEDEPYSPEDSDPEGLLMPTVTRKSSSKAATANASSVSAAVAAVAAAANLKTADLSSVLSATLKSTTFLETTSAVPSFEPFSNKFDGIPGLDVDSGVDSLARKMAELDKCIEKQKEEIRSISQDIVSSGAAASMTTNLSNISLPSNLQQILDSIKNIPSTNSNSQDAVTEEYCPTAPGYKSTPNSASDELTIPLLLPKLSSRTQTVSARTTGTPEPNKTLGMSSMIPLQLPVGARDSPGVVESITLPNLTVPPPMSTVPLALPNTNVPPPVVLPNLSVPPPTAGLLPSSSSTIPLNLPKVKTKAVPTPVPAPVPAPVAAPTVSPPMLTPPGTAPVVIPPSVEPKPAESKPASVLSSLSEEELIRKAAEMLGEAEPVREDTPEPEEEPRKDEPTSESAFQPSSAFISAPNLFTPAPAATNPAKRTKFDVSQPPVPGLEDEYSN